LKFCSRVCAAVSKSMGNIPDLASGVTVVVLCSDFSRETVYTKYLIY
jgi:hypothetical protein